MVYVLIRRLNFEYLHDNKTADPNQSRVIDHTKTISLNLARVGP